MQGRIGAVSKLLVVVILAGAMAGLVAQAAEQGNASNGKAHYEQYCAMCHGKRGLGNGPMAKATTPPASKLTTREVREKSDEQLLKDIADGVGSTMPAWRGVLNDQQLLDVVAYVRALSG